MEGLIGQNDEDPDSPKDTSGTNDSYIRQSDVKWIEHEKMYQEIQDKILDVKEQTRKSNNLYMLDTARMKMFNGFFFMMNKNIIQYEKKIYNHSSQRIF